MPLAVLTKAMEGLTLSKIAEGDRGVAVGVALGIGVAVAVGIGVGVSVGAAVAVSVGAGDAVGWTSFVLQPAL